MIDLAKLAESLASKGIIASVDVRIWDGYLPARPEWGNIRICAFSDEMSTTFLDATRMFDQLLSSHSIPCSDGCFVPSANIAQWSSEYAALEVSFNKAKQSTMLASDAIRQSVKSMAAESTVIAWRTKNPDDPTPPPSLVVCSSNLAASMIPRKEDFLDAYGVSRRACDHSFIFCLRDQRASFIGKSERSFMAWRVVDELVAGNIRRLDSKLRKSMKRGIGVGRKLTLMQEGALTFSRTDLMPELGVSTAVDELLSLIRNKMAVDIDRSAVSAEVGKILDFTSDLMTVSGILGRL